MGVVRGYIEAKERLLKRFFASTLREGGEIGEFWDLWIYFGGIFVGCGDQMDAGGDMRETPAGVLFGVDVERERRGRRIRGFLGRFRRGFRRDRVESGFSVWMRETGCDRALPRGRTSDGVGEMSSFAGF